MAEGTHGERMQQSKILVKRQLILSLPTVWGFYNCLIKEHTITECRQAISLFNECCAARILIVVYMLGSSRRLLQIVSGVRPSLLYIYSQASQPNPGAPINKLVFVSQKTRKLFGPKIFVGLVSGAMFFRKCLHNAANFSKIFPRIASQQSELESHTTVVINFVRASNCLHEIFSSSCAVFLGFHNVSIFCHLTVKACQIISDFLAVCLNELETSLIYSS